MTIVYPTTDITSTGDAITDSTTISVQTGDELIIAEGIDVVSTNGHGVYLITGVFDVHVDGTIAGQDGAIRFWSRETSFDVSASVGQTGTLLASSFALYLGSDFDSDYTGNTNAVTNAGNIVSFNSAAAFLFHSEFVTVHNTGHMVSQGVNGSYNNGLCLFSDINASVFNSGLIATSCITNSSYGAAVAVVQNTHNVHLVNTGTISGPTLAYWSNATSSETIINHGVMTGNVKMSDAIGSTLINSGQIDGDVDLGGGNDLYRAQDQGTATGLVDGGAGIDTLVGAARDDWMLGGTSNDLMRGGAGEDSLNGGGGNDQMRGGEGDDWMRGWVGRDFMAGDAGNDEMHGEAGTDTMRGGAGDDTLFGGGDRDVMFGDSGADVFAFESTADSAVGAQRDTIRDFERGVDTLDVSAVIGSQFQFIGTSAFSGTAPELRYFSTPAAVVVELDANGDGTADSQIVLTGIVDLGHADLVL